MSKTADNSPERVGSETHIQALTPAPAVTAAQSIAERTAFWRLGGTALRHRRALVAARAAGRSTRE